MKMYRLKHGRLLGLMILWMIGCTSKQIKPVEIFPEDMCSNCRMTISDQSFVSEIITQENEVFKFDDIGCMEQFQSKSSGFIVTAIFLKDYDSRKWMPFYLGFIVKTGVKTPMGSGKVAFADSLKAIEFTVLHPVLATNTTQHSCCAQESD